MLNFSVPDRYDDLVMITEEGRILGHIIKGREGYGVAIGLIYYNPDYLRQIADKLDELNKP